MLVDLRPKGLKGNVSEKALVRAAITCNKNGIPFDPETPFVTSGLRLGTPAATTRGFGVAEFQQVAGMIAEVLNAHGAVAGRQGAVGGSRDQGTGQGADRPLPDLSVKVCKPDALSQLQQSRYAGEGLRVRPRIPP